MQHTAILLYLPALHSGYIKLFNKWAGRADILYILGQDLLDQFPILEREIRAIDPETMQKIMRGSNYFPHVEVISIDDLKRIAKDDECFLVLTDEQISNDLRAKYFPDKEIIQETLFLRYDEKVVKAARKEVEFLGTVSSEDFDQKVLRKALQESQKSSDWFLRVGAALVIDDPLEIRYGHNMRMPAPHSPWIAGDVRMYTPYGTDTHIRTSLHAEQAVIASAARDGIKIEGASMYVTTFPCPDCSQLIAESGIKRVYFKDGFSELSTTDVFEAYKIEIVKVID
jgi:dCMP deaminase